MDSIPPDKQTLMLLLVLECWREPTDETKGVPERREAEQGTGETNRKNRGRDEGIECRQRVTKPKALLGGGRQECSGNSLVCCGGIPWSAAGSGREKKKGKKHTGSSGKSFLMTCGPSQAACQNVCPCLANLPIEHYLHIRYRR